MRRLEYTNQFERDYKREKKNPNNRNIDIPLVKIVDLLLIDSLLPESNKDHPLKGEYVGNRECHVKPDLLLIYFKTGKDVVTLVRLGSHSSLF